MKSCSSCGQILAQSITRCPACGSPLVPGLKSIDDYQIQHIIHEGRSSIVCRAVKKQGGTPVTLRLFTDISGVNAAVAQRLENELEILAKLPPDLFVQHYAIKQSSTGLWYRISEWVDAESWGTLFVSGTLKDQRRMATLFYNIASALDILNQHDHFMPYLILDDILIPKDKAQGLSVKINFKLSRFLNVGAAHHGPMLKKLLKCHPDIINGRAVDFRSGIWSLGKIFIELLSADHNLTRFSDKVDTLTGLDPELAVLIKVMLSEDPDLRPQSMAKIAAALARILERMPHKDILAVEQKKYRQKRELKGFKEIVILLLVIIVGIVAFNTLSRFYLADHPGSQEAVFSRFIDSHTNAVGFLMVEYWLKDQEEIIYKNKVEGTAFLVDPQGYLLTNRHVACPWLEDSTLFQIRYQYQLLEKNLEFDHRMFLWFEGAKAFQRLPALKNSKELSDTYYLASAFQSNGKNNLRTVGVPRIPDKPGNSIHALFKHDFAVLKIDGIPNHLSPLPLALGESALDIDRLSPVIIMGFPLGNRTQDDYINASITRGHVRRTSKELIQVDSSIYKGNSGGPAVNARGRVIGIASGVVTEQASEYIPLRTPLSDFGLVLPISQPARFIEALKAGQPKWDGKLDFSLNAKLKQALALAGAHQYKAAADLTDTLLATSNDPTLIFTSAVLHFCSNNMETSRSLFTRQLSIEGENTIVRLMLFLIDWITGQKKSRHLTKDLFALNWQHQDEFLGYLARVLKDKQKIKASKMDFENRSEKAWRIFIQALILEKENQTDLAMAHYKDAVLLAGADEHLYFMAFSRFDRLTEKTKAEQKKFWARADLNKKQAQEKYAKASKLIQKFESIKTSNEEKTAAYKALMELSPDNLTIIGRIAFFHAMNSQWTEALEFIERFFESRTRETALSLSLGLLRGQILKLSDTPGTAHTSLETFWKNTKNPWYSIISKGMAGQIREDNLIRLAGNNSHKLITLHTALGLWAEGDSDRERAVHHYREALGTYLDGWNEYDLALARIMRIREGRD